MNAIRLYIDWTTKQAYVSSQRSATYQFLKLYQNDIVPLEIIIMQPSPQTAHEYSLPAIGNLAMQVFLAVGGTVYAEQTSWDKDETNKIFSGTLDLSTAALDTYLGSTNKNLDLVFRVAEAGGGTVTAYLENVLVVVDPHAGASPTTIPGLTVLYKEFADKQYVKRIGSAGETITLTSKTTGKQVVLGANDDGSFDTYQI